MTVDVEQTLSVLTIEDAVTAPDFSNRVSGAARFS